MSIFSPLTAVLPMTWIFSRILFNLLRSLQDTGSQTSNITLKEHDPSWSSGEVLKIEASGNSSPSSGSLAASVDKVPAYSSTVEATAANSFLKDTGSTSSIHARNNDPVDETRKDDRATSTSGSPWYQLRKDATGFVSQTLQRGRRNLWQLTTSRVSVLLTSSAVCSASIHQFLKNYEDLNIFILAGEAFCGVEAVEFRQKLKAVCENYFIAFHRQIIYVSLT